MKQVTVKSVTLINNTSPRKQPKFRCATPGFPAKWRLRNERSNSIFMTRHYPDLVSASDWLKHICHAARPIRRTTQNWLVTGHQYGISVLVSQTSFRGETSGSAVKCRLLSQVKTTRVDIGRFPLSPKFRILVRNQIELTTSVWFDRNIWNQLWRWSTLTVRSDRNVFFQLTKLLSPVPLVCILLTWTITKGAVAWVGCVQPQCTVPLVRGVSEISYRNFCWMGSAHRDR